MVRENIFIKKIMMLHFLCTFFKKKFFILENIYVVYSPPVLYSDALLHKDTIHNTNRNKMKSI